MTKTELFTTTYAQELTRAIEDHPEEYGYPASAVAEVVVRMTAAIRLGHYNKDSRAIRATCKRLGIRYTYRAIAEYLKEEPCQENERRRA